MSHTRVCARAQSILSLGTESIAFCDDFEPRVQDASHFASNLGLMVVILPCEPKASGSNPGLGLCCPMSRWPGCRTPRILQQKHIPDEFLGIPMSSSDFLGFCAERTRVPDTCACACAQHSRKTLASAQYVHRFMQAHACPTRVHLCARRAQQTSNVFCLVYAPFLCKKHIPDEFLKIPMSS